MDRIHDAGHPQGEGPAHDRLDRRARDRGGAHALPGQVDHQLDQPRGRRGALREGRAARSHATARAVVVGCIDEDKRAGHGGHARAQARRSPSAAYELLTEQVRRPGARTSSSTRSCSRCGTGDAELRRRRASRRSRAFALIKQRFPDCKTILGISNVSFGLPPAGREVLNSVFLYHCTKAGLDYAIVNTEQLERYAVDSRGGAAARRGSDLLDAATIRSRPSRRTSAARTKAPPARARRCRSTSGSRATSSRAAATA